MRLIVVLSETPLGIPLPIKLYDRTAYQRLVAYLSWKFVKEMQIRDADTVCRLILRLIILIFYIGV